MSKANFCCAFSKPKTKYVYVLSITSNPKPQTCPILAPTCATKTEPPVGSSPMRSVNCKGRKRHEFR